MASKKKTPAPAASDRVVVFVVDNRHVLMGCVKESAIQRFAHLLPKNWQVKPATEAMRYLRSYERPSEAATGALASMLQALGA